MAEKIEHIGKKEIVWSYAGTAFKIGAGLLLLPFILQSMSEETVGVWTLFQTITYLVLLLDFGFRPSFARNISYIFTGVKTLKKEGVAHASSDAEVDYGLLKGTLVAMRKFYRWISLAVFGLLITIGTVYFYFFVLNQYSGDRQDALIAWILLIVINCYNLYTLYYDALLIGKGYITRCQQINILGQTIYILLAIGLIYAGWGLTAIVASQLISTIIRRVLTYQVFFTKEMKARLVNAKQQEPKAILSAITPNAVKIGLTQLGGFMVNKAAMIIAPMFIGLDLVARYGTTVMVMDVLAQCGAVFYQSYMPKLAQCRAEQDLKSLKRYYILCIGSLIAVFAVGGLLWVAFGNWALELIGSDTRFVGRTMLGVMLLICLLEHNHAISAGFIMADNKIPFFIPSLVSGAATILLLWIFLGPLGWGIWGLILAPGIAQLAYQNWKWPSVVIKELWGKCKK